MDLGVKSLPSRSSDASWKSGDVINGRFPAGMRVLVVDDDRTCLRITEKMLKNCLYEVTSCNRAEAALNFLRDNKNGCDIVIIDVHMPDMDGFKFLEYVGLEMDLPVIMMSADDSKHSVMKGVTRGACDYLNKPVCIEALRNIWQHVVRKRKQQSKGNDLEHSGSVEEGEKQQKPPVDVDCSSLVNQGDSENSKERNVEEHEAGDRDDTSTLKKKPLEDVKCCSSGNEGNSKNSKKRKCEEDEAEDRDDTSKLKKPRVAWSADLHLEFLSAVNRLGVDKAVPKKILELMNVPGLTRENVASHLQKHRINLKRLNNGVGNGVHYQAQRLPSVPAAAVPQANLPLPLVELRNTFNQSALSMKTHVHSQSNSLPMQSRTQILNEVNGMGQNRIGSYYRPHYTCISEPSTSADLTVFSANTSPLMRNSGFWSTGMNVHPNYNTLSNLDQNGRSTFVPPRHSNMQGGFDVLSSALSANLAASALEEGPGNIPGISQQQFHYFTSETLPEMGFQNGGYYGQEDFVSELLNQVDFTTSELDQENHYA